MRAGKAGHNVTAMSNHTRNSPGLSAVALFFIDDATRYRLHVVVGTDECAELFLSGLHGLVRPHGLMDLLCLDKAR